MLTTRSRSWQPASNGAALQLGCPHHRSPARSSNAGLRTRHANTPQGRSWAMLTRRRVCHVCILTFRRRKLLPLPSEPNERCLLTRGTWCMQFHMQASRAVPPTRAQHHLAHTRPDLPRGTCPTQPTTPTSAAKHLACAARPP
jgi:hypothetical protein